MGDKRELVLAELKSDIICNYSKRRGQIKTLLKVSDDLNLFACKETASISNVISQINLALNSRKNRLDALYLLQNVIDQCAADIFTQHWQQWVKATIQIIQNDDSTALCQIACNILNTLLLHLKSSESGHQFATGLLPAILTEIMQKLKDKDLTRHVILVQVFTIIAKHFPGPCGPFAGKMESHLIRMFDSANEWIQNLAAECFAMLPQCGGGGNMGLKHTEFWSNAAMRLLSGLHDTLDQLYFKLEAGTSWPHRPALNLLKFDEVEQLEPCRSTTLAIRFRGLCFALKYMLSGEFSAVVRLPVMAILEVIDRTIAMSPQYLLAKPTSQRIHVSAIVPLLHEQALHILQELTLSARREMVPYAEIVNNWQIQMLNWSSTTAAAEPGLGTIHGPLRCTIYDTLSVWMQTLGGASGTETLATNLIRHAVADCSLAANSLKFRMTLKLGKVEAAFSSNKKRKVGSASADLDQATMYRKISTESGEGLCCASIEVLRNILLYCGHSLSADHHRTIQDLCRLPLTFFSKKEIPVPYNVAACRRSMYQLLLSILVSSVPMRPSPDQLIMRSFSVGLNDDSPEVRHCCSEALCITENIAHPRLPVLGIHTSGSCAPHSTANDLHDTSAFAFTTYRNSNMEGSNGIESSDVDLYSLPTTVNANRKDTSAMSSYILPAHQVEKSSTQTVASSLSSLPTRKVETSVKLVASCEISERLSHSSKKLFNDAPMEVDKNNYSVSNVGITDGARTVSSLVPSSRTQLTEPSQTLTVVVQTIHVEESNGMSNCKSDAPKEELKAARRKRKGTSDTELDENDIEPEDLEEMIQSFNYT